MKNSKSHIRYIFSVLILCCLIAVGNIFYVMLFKTHIWSQESVLNPSIATSLVTTVTDGKRGTIYDRNNIALAQETEAWTMVAYIENRSQEEIDEITYYDPADYVQDIDSFIASIKEVLGDAIDEKTIRKAYEQAKEKGYSQIELGTGTKRLDTQVMEELAMRKIPGLGFIQTTKRTYPTSPFSSNLIGYATYNDETEKIYGAIGLEYSLESYLSGESGIIQYQQTRTNDAIPGTSITLQSATDGYDVHLTLDSNLQRIVEQQMEATLESNKADKAWCLVMEVETGKILAWASYPTFDQNDAKEIPSYTDNITEMNYEPGSVIKPLTYAVAVDTGVFPYNTDYRAGEFTYTVDENGTITRIDNGAETVWPSIKDALETDYGTLSYEEGLAHSSNIAIASLLSQYISKQNFVDYMHRFGLYQKVGIPFINEIAGVENNETAIDYLSSGFGQASSISVIQLAQAYTSIFNDGQMLRPYVVESISDPNTGEIIKEYEPTVVGNPISANTASQIRQMMYQVLEPEMSGERFKMEGVDMIAKTGTGEVYDPETHTYSTNKWNSSIMAAVPGNDPKVMIYYGMVSPTLNWGASPFQEIVKAALVAANVQSNASYSVRSSTMPELINHSATYALSQLASKSARISLLGDGTSIINQYPKAGDPVNANDVVLLLSEGTNFKMPDMTGWTRKDVNAFSELTGIPVTCEGYNTVLAQNIEEGEEITPASEIVLTLSSANPKKEDNPVVTDEDEEVIEEESDDEQVIISLSDITTAKEEKDSDTEEAEK